MGRDLFLHIGASKSGTSSFQVGVRASLEALAEAGLGVAFPGRLGRFDNLLRPLGFSNPEGFSGDIDGARLDRTTRRLRRTEGDRVLVTAENLAELDEKRVGALVGRIEADTQLRPHVIITARTWSATLPSEWQQQLKRRLTTDYRDWLWQVESSQGPDAASFRNRQDVADIVRRWSAWVPADRVHVVPVGGPGQHQGSIFDGVSRVMGIEPSLISRAGHPVNKSFGWVECEVLRRLNAELGDRLSLSPAPGETVSAYNVGVRRVLDKGVLTRAGQLRVPLPPDAWDWVSAEMARQVHALRETGVDEVFDLDLLMPRGEHVAALPEVDETEISRAMIETWANFVVATYRRTASLQESVRELEQRVDPA